MAYTIDEQNLDRQRLLAHILRPLTAPHLKRIAPTRSGRWLDVGSGLGETTRMLSRFMTMDSECIGVDQDSALLEVARSQDWAGRRVSFEQGDATSLPFDDNSFDFVFSRYLLIHMPEPVKAIREMIRVAKPGGAVLAHEPDLAFACCYPPSPAYEQIPAMWAAVFPHPLMGRRLVHLFREAGATSPQAAADSCIEHNCTDIKRLYRMTFESIGAALVQKGAITQTEFEEHAEEFRVVESDPSITVMAQPNVAVWASV